MTSAKTTNVFAARPPHFVVRDAFDPELVERLLAYALTREADFTGTRVGRQGSSDTSVRRSRVIRDFGPLTEVLEHHFCAALPAAMSALRLAPFTLATLSLELAAHGDGDFYRRHIDTFVGTSRQGTDRVLTGVYYFHSLPKAFDGGALRLFSVLPPENGGCWIDMEPLHNSLLMFPAWVPHEVRPISCPGGAFAQSRFAINCWYNQLPASKSPPGPSE
jgi:Rps23 Pro-64 3,4-dihydroxylase Tpa1-like proline 4-hydroxylase